MSLETCVECPKFVGLRVRSVGAVTHLACRSEETSNSPQKPRLVAVPSAGTKVISLVARDTLRLSPELGIDEVVTLLVSKSLPHAAVVDAASRPLGLISRADLLHWFWQGPGKTRKALCDVMARLPSIRGEALAADAAREMWASGVECLAVVSASGRFEGLLSAVDLLPCLLARSAPPETER